MHQHSFSPAILDIHTPGASAPVQTVKPAVFQFHFTEAPEVARYYLNLEDPLYRRESHSVGMLLKHCEHLRSLWVRSSSKPSGTEVLSAEDVVVAL